MTARDELSITVAGFSRSGDIAAIRWWDVSISGAAPCLRGLRGTSVETWSASTSPTRDLDQPEVNSLIDRGPDQAATDAPGSLKLKIRQHKISIFGATMAHVFNLERSDQASAVDRLLAERGREEHFARAPAPRPVSGRPDAVMLSLRHSATLIRRTR